MKIKMSRSLGTATGSFAVGQVVDVDDDLAESWVGHGAAEAVEPELDESDRKAAWVDKADELGLDVDGLNKADVVEAVREALG